MSDLLQTMLLMLLAVSLGTVFLRRIFVTEQDPREPPLISARIPYIGHLIGLMRNTFNYYVQLSQQNSLPIFTIKIPGAKLYIVTSLELVQAIQKDPQNLAFPPIVTKFGAKISGFRPEAEKIFMSDVWGIYLDVHSVMQSALLSAGPDLDNMNRVMLQSLAASLDSLEVPADNAKLKLFRWLRGNVTLATTNSIYGPQNPFKDDLVADAFWQFESKLVHIFLGVLPSITARKGIAGRTKVIKALEHYFRTEGHKKASILMRNRYEAGVRNGIVEDDLAPFEIMVSVGLLINTVPAAFWMLLFIHLHPGLLDAIRIELDSVVTKTVDNGLVRCLDVTLLKTKCHLLTSTFQEVLRYQSMGTPVRQVMQDTVLNGQWLLKKDCMIQMPSRVIHSDCTLWGTDADKFNPRRFMKDEGQKKKRLNPAAFRAFGGGTTLCPGRHFATNEVLAVVSMFVMRYDMKPTAGEWSLPETKNTDASAVLMAPDTDIEVEVSSRKGFEDGRWIYDLKDSRTFFALVAEDRADLPAGEKPS